jgi:predicted nucleotidyltransferase
MTGRGHATHDLASPFGDIYTKEGIIIVRSGMDMTIVQCGGECARIVGILRANREHLEKTYHIRSIGLFGSCRRGEEHEGSDADILVEFSEVPGFFDYLRLEGHLTEILGRKVDLVEKSALKPRIARRIGKEVIYI